MIGRDSQGRPPFNTVLANEVEADSPGYHTALYSTEVATVFHVAESTSVKIHKAETMRISSATPATTNIYSHVKRKHDVNVTTSREDKDLTESGSKADVQNINTLPDSSAHGKDTQPNNLGELSSIEPDDGDILAGISETRAVFVHDPCRNEDSTSATSFSSDSRQENVPIFVTGNDTRFEEKSSSDSDDDISVTGNDTRFEDKSSSDSDDDISVTGNDTRFGKKSSSDPDDDIEKEKYVDTKFKIDELNDVEIKREPTESFFPEEQSVKNSLAARAVGQASQMRVRSLLTRKYSLTMSASKNKTSFNRQPLASISLTAAMSRSTFNWRGVNSIFGIHTKAFTVGKTHDPKSSNTKGRIAKEEMTQGIVVKTEEGIDHFASLAEDTSQQIIDEVQSPKLNLGRQQVKGKIFTAAVGTCINEKSAFQNVSDTELPGGNLTMQNKVKGGQWLEDGVSSNSKEEITELHRGGSATKSNDDDILLPDEMSVMKSKREMLKLSVEGSVARSEEEIIELPGEKSRVENKEIIVELPDKVSERKNKNENIELLGEGCNTKNNGEIVELRGIGSEKKSTKMIELAEIESEKKGMEKSRTSTEEMCDKSNTSKEFDKSLQVRKEITKKFNSSRGSRFGKSSIMVQSNSGRRIETTVSCQSLNHKQYGRIFREMLTVPEESDSKGCGNGSISTIFDKLRLCSMRKDSLGNTQADQLQPKIKQHRDTAVSKIPSKVFEVGCERSKSMSSTLRKDIDSQSKIVESQETTTPMLNVHQSRTETSTPMCDSSTEAPLSTNKARQHKNYGERKTCAMTFSEMSPSPVEREPRDCKQKSDDKHNTSIRSNSPSSSTNDVGSSSLTNDQVESESDGNAPICAERTKIQVKKRGRPPGNRINRSFRYLKRSNLKPVINLTKASSNSGEVHRNYDTRRQSVNRRSHVEIQDSDFEEPFDTVAARTRANDTDDHNLSKSNIKETTSQSKNDVKQTSSDGDVNKESTHDIEKHDYRVKPCFVSVRRIDSRWIESKLTRKEHR